MADECFNCKGEASDHYTLILEQRKVLEDKLLCEPCASSFRDVEWIEVIEAPTLLRGGTQNSDDEENSA